jgi:hypothetical protein
MAADNQLLATGGVAKARANTLNLGVGSDRPAVVTLKVAVFSRRSLLGKAVVHEYSGFGVAHGNLVSHVGLKGVVCPLIRAIVLGYSFLPVNESVAETDFSEGPRISRCAGCCHRAPSVHVELNQLILINIGRGNV